MKRIIILIPIFNDWDSLNKLLAEINNNIKDCYMGICLQREPILKYSLSSLETFKTLFAGKVSTSITLP